MPAARPWSSTYRVGIDGASLANATVDVWHSDNDGYYDVQLDDPSTSLRARFRTDPAGGFSFWSILPSSYSIPVDGPVGEMLAAQGRHGFRPAHVHFKIAAPRHRELVTHVFVSGDEYLLSDAVFGVKETLIADFVLHGPGDVPDGRQLAEPWAQLTYDFALGHANAVSQRST